MQSKQLSQLNDDSKKIQTLLRALLGVLKKLVLRSKQASQRISI